MSYDHGPLREYGVVWKDGRAEIIKAHQVLLPTPGLLFGERDRNRITFHGEVGGHWLLILDADYDTVQSVRLLSETPAEGEATP